MEQSLQHGEPAFFQARIRQDCCEGYQPLRRRGAKSIRGLIVAAPCRSERQKVLCHMKLQLSILPALHYDNESQRIRDSTEVWAAENLYCANCGGPLDLSPANTKTKDFDCARCGESFQLKSMSRPIAGTVLGASYLTTRRSIEEGSHPSIIVLSYDRTSLKVHDVQIVHRAGISSTCIRPRKPLRATAGRAGWQGCDWLLGQLPPSAKIDVVQNGTEVPKKEVMKRWRETADLFHEKLDCPDRIPRSP